MQQPFIRSAFSESGSDQVSFKRVVGVLCVAILATIIFMCLAGYDKSLLPESIVESIFWIALGCIFGTYKQPEFIARIFGGGSKTIEQTTVVQKKEETSA